jgi:hypothetical protein
MSHYVVCTYRQVDGCATPSPRRNDPLLVLVCIGAAPSLSASRWKAHGSTWEWQKTAAVIRILVAYNVGFLRGESRKRRPGGENKWILSSIFVQGEKQRTGLVQKNKSNTRRVGITLIRALDVEKRGWRTTNARKHCAVAWLIYLGEPM